MKLCNIAKTVLFSGLVAVSTTGCDSQEERERKYIDRAKIQIEQGDPVKARLEIRNALQINNESAEALYLRSLLFEEERNWRKMMQDLNGAVEADPTYMPAQIKRTTLYYEFGPEADDITTSSAEAILELDPGNVEAIVLLGRVALRAGNVEEAIAQAERALALGSASVSPYVLLGEIYKDDPEKSFSYLEQGLKANPGSAELLLTKIRVFKQKGDIDTALEGYKQLAATHPDNLDYPREMLSYMSENDRIAEAEQFLTAQIEAQPGVSEYKIWLIQLLLSANEQERAIAQAEKFIAQNADEAELYYLLSDIQLSVNQGEDAIDTLTKLLKRLPGDSAEANKAMARVAEISLRTGDVETAEDYINRVLENDPDDPSALLLSADMHLRAGEIEEAIIKLRSTLRRDPDSFRARMALAGAHEANGSLDLAMDSYQAALELEPGNVRLALKIATLFYEQEETEAGNRLLQRYLASEQTAPVVAPPLIESFAGEQKWPQAMEVVNALKAQEPNQSLGIYLEGGLYFEQQDFDKAIETFESLLEMEPGSTRVLSAITRAKVAQSSEQAAIEYLEAYSKQYPSLEAPHELRAVLYSDAGDVPAAVRAYEDALAVRPDNANIHLAISRLHQAAGDIEAAKRSIDNAAAVAPDNPNLLVLKAGLLERQANYREAAALYEQVLADSPGNVIAANNLAMILVDHFPGQESTARAVAVTEAFEQASEPVFLDTRAWVLYFAGNYARARVLLEKAVSDEQKIIPVYQYHLGMVYAKLGENAAAREQLESALESGNEFAGMEEARETLEALSAPGN